MTTREELTLTIHGLDEFHQAVDAEVFAGKFAAFVKGLTIADKAVNAGERKHKYLVADLRKNTATAQIREQALDPFAGSGAAFYRSGLTAVADGRPDAIGLPEGLIKEIAKLGAGVGKNFAFAEVKEKDTVVVRIDQLFADRSAQLMAQKANDNLAHGRLFKGTAYGSFDGVLELIDIRQDHRKAILTLTAGGLAIDCDVATLDLDKLRSVLGVRGTAYGVARYDGVRPLPAMLEVRDVTPIKVAGDLARWRGTFDILDTSDAEDDWG